MTTWGIYTGTSEPHDGIATLPEAPPWRNRGGQQLRGSTYQASAAEIEAVNAALLLRRPLLITGKPGVGKSSLAYAVAYELKLGAVLRWSITTRSTLREGLYEYDAIGRLQEANVRKLQAGDSADLPLIGKYIRLGPLGTALLPGERPRVLLIDEIDKSDLDLPNDLLHVFEEGEIIIPELARLPAEEAGSVEVQTWDGRTATISGGTIPAGAFPLVILTSNGERDFPPAFKRRCLRLTITEPNREQLRTIVRAHLGSQPDEALPALIETIIGEFLHQRDEQKQLLATDQLLNAVYLATQDINITDRASLRELLLHSLAR